MTMSDEQQESELLADFQNLQISAEAWAENEKAELDRLKRKLSKNPKLKSPEQNGYCKWFGDAAEDSFTWDGVIEILRSLNLSDILNEINDKTREYMFTDLFSRQLNISFLNVLLGKEKEARKNLKEASESLEYFRTIVLAQPPNKIVQKDEEHLQGAEFILHSLRLLLKLQFEDSSSFNTAFQKFPRYDTLSPKAQAFVLITRSNFLVQFPQSTSNGYEAKRIAISKALELDSHWEWYVENFQCLRQSRRYINNQKAPCAQETNFIQTAYKLNPKHPFCILRTCQFLAEYVKGVSRNRTGESFPLEFGTRTFNDIKDVVEFLKQQAEEFLKVYSTFSMWLNQFGKFFSSDLPSHPVNYRDRNMAEKFLLKALSISPESSITNHRMGIFYTQDKKFSKAKIFLQKAVKTAIQNNQAMVDYLKNLMGNISENSDEIKRVLNEAIPVYEKSKSGYYKSLLFLKGYFYFQIRERDLAIQTWLKWTTITEDVVHWSICFNNIQDHAAHSGWPRIELEDLQSIRRVVSNYQRFDGENGPYPELLSLIDEGVMRATPERWRSRTRN